MGQNGLPRLDLLSATPHMLHGLMCELSSEDAQWKPAQDRFSVAEVLAHLSHSEGHCYRLCVERFMTEEMPELEPNDAQKYLDLYRLRDAICRNMEPLCLLKVHHCPETGIREVGNRVGPGLGTASRRR